MKSRLSAKDYAQVIDCIEAIHQCRSLDDFPKRVLAELSKLIECTLAGYNEVNLKRNRIIIELVPPWTDEGTAQLQKNFAKVMHEHPVISYFNETGDGQTLMISDFLTPDEFHSLSIYRDAYRGMGVEDQISFAVKVEDGFIIGIAFNRAERTFTEKDRLRLNLVRPHVIQAYLNAAEIAGYREEQQDLQVALRESGVGVIVLNAAGIVTHSTPGVFECLARYLPVPDGEGGASKLPSKLEQWAAPSAHDDTAPGHTPFVVARGSAALTIRRVCHEGRIVLMLSEDPGPDAATDTPPGMSDPLAHYHLTPREREVLRWVAEGKSNSEIAAILGLAVGTVKLHVERIMAKLGVENRTAAASIAMRAANGM